MVLEGLTSSLRDTLRKIANATHIDRTLVKDVVRDIQRALLQADVNAKLAVELTKEVERRALTERPPAGMSSREHVIRIIYDELVRTLGESREISLKRHVILLVGLYGQGKTTTAAKLAKYYQRKGLKVGMIAGDVHRPAAIDQLCQLGAQINVPVYAERDEPMAPKIVRRGLRELGAKHDIIIIDTAGRHSLEPSLIKEMRVISKISKADERFLVLDATIGQQAGPQAKAFHDAVDITGVILTKLDGSARGGGALSAVAETKAPIVYIGTGEKLDDMERFDPPRFISRMLGMGDIQSLLERAQEAISEEKAEETARKLMSGKFTLKDMYEQMDMISSMGPIKKLFSMLPFGMFGGLGGKLSDDALADTQDKLRKFKIIMDSMTDDELAKPHIIKSSRIKRIARGSGSDPKDVRALLKYYDMTRKAVKGFASNRKIRRTLMQQLKFGEGNFGL